MSLRKRLTSSRGHLKRSSKPLSLGPVTMKTDSLNLALVEERKRMVDRAIDLLKAMDTDNDPDSLFVKSFEIELIEERVSVLNNVPDIRLASLIDASLHTPIKV